MVEEECLAAWKECREEEAFEACLFFYANCSPPSGTYAALAAVLRKWSREVGVRILHAYPRTDPRTAKTRTKGIQERTRRGIERTTNKKIKRRTNKRTRKRERTSERR